MNDSKNIDNVSRKEFLRKAGSTALFATLGIGFFGCSKVTGSGEEMEPDGEAIIIDGDTITINLDMDDVSNLREAGGWMLITQATTLVVNVDGETIRAFTSVCTHAQCSTSWSFRDNEFTCQCHLSKFNTSGQVVSGPATRDLEEFAVMRDDNIVTIIK